MGRKVSRKAARKKFHNQHEFAVDDFTDVIPQKRKRWSTHDIRTIRPMTNTQQEFLESWFSGSSVCAHGSAGTGKSFLAVYAALSAVFDPRDDARKIMIVRSAVTTREVGHLPGTLEEKQSIYEQPYRDIFADLCGRDSTYQDMKDAGYVQFMLTSHVRGLTWDNAVVIVDEAQNMTWSEIDSVVTRMGHNSRLIICGDGSHQQDLKRGEVSGFANMLRVLEDVENFTCIAFTSHDVVRSGLAKSWILARNNLNL